MTACNVIKKTGVRTLIIAGQRPAGFCGAGRLLDARRRCKGQGGVERAQGEGDLISALDSGLGEAARPAGLEFWTSVAMWPCQRGARFETAREACAMYTLRGCAVVEEFLLHCCKTSYAHLRLNEADAGVAASDAPVSSGRELSAASVEPIRRKFRSAFLASYCPTMTVPTKP